MAATVGLLVAIAAALAAVRSIAIRLWKFGKWCVRVAKGIEAIHGLIEHELQPNSGGSMYDKLTRVDDVLAEHIAESTKDRERLAVVEHVLGIPPSV